MDLSPLAVPVRYRVIDLRKFFFGRAWTERPSTSGENAFFST
jgi:hypothetical protein